jgi:hypothetical protein
VTRYDCIDLKHLSQRLTKGLTGIVASSSKGVVVRAKITKAAHCITSKQ